MTRDLYEIGKVTEFSQEVLKFEIGQCNRLKTTIRVHNVLRVNFCLREKLLNWLNKRNTRFEEGSN